jgi:hypothetical protein
MRNAEGVELRKGRTGGVLGRLAGWQDAMVGLLWCLVAGLSLCLHNGHKCAES